MSNNPTAKQKAMWNKVAENGCMACLQNGFHTQPEIHHWREYGYKDHDLVFGLCPRHHSIVRSVVGVLNRHKDKLEFQDEFGTDKELYLKCMKMIGVKPKEV